MKSSRKYYLDAIRVIACAMVVLMHSPGPWEGQAGSGLFQAVLNYFTAPCIGLFFMVSGALLLPVKEQATLFLRRRLSKVLMPTLIWTAFYLLVSHQSHSGHWLQVVLSVPFSPQGSGVLWFMYTLVGLYLIAPVISPWIQAAKRSEIELYLMIWAVTMCFPLMETYLKIRQDIAGPFYYLSGYVGYFLLGYYLNRWPHRLSWKLLLPLCGLSILAPVYCKLTGMEVDFQRVFWYLSIFVAVMCAVWFKVMNEIFALPSIKTHKFPILSKISALSFGIYLCHIYLLREIFWNMGAFNALHSYIAHTVAVAAATFLCSLVVSYVISLLPFGAFVVGSRTILKSKTMP